MGSEQNTPIIAGVVHAARTGHGVEAMSSTVAVQVERALAAAGRLRDTTPPNRTVRQGVCLVCGDGVLNSGDHIDPERHLAALEAVIAEAQGALASGAVSLDVIRTGLAALARAGDPVVLRGHDAQVLRDAAHEWWKRTDLYNKHDGYSWLRARADAVEKGEGS